ncbi:MAG: methylmalonyl Co-A mutase-associated GTPase MeaB, partial [Acidimicrobiales bacterium]
GADARWRPTIVETVASTGAGTSELYEAIEAHRRHLEADGLDGARRQRVRAELDKVLASVLRSRVVDLARGVAYEEQLDALVAGETDPYRAAEALLGAP